MRRRPARPTPARLFAATVLAGVLALLVAGAIIERRDAFTLGVPGRDVAAQLEPSSEVCQGPVRVPERFAAVRLATGTFHRPGPELGVRVLGVPEAQVLGRGRLPGGYKDLSEPRVALGSIGPEQLVHVCVANRGSAPVALFGSGQLAAASVLRLNGRAIRADIMLKFERAEPEKLVTALPGVLRRAALFRADWVGPWVFWLLGAALFAGVPLLVLAALRSVTGEPRQ